MMAKRRDGMIENARTLAKLPPKGDKRLEKIKSFSVGLGENMELRKPSTGEVVGLSTGVSLYLGCSSYPTNIVVSCPVTLTRRRSSNPFDEIDGLEQAIHEALAQAKKLIEGHLRQQELAAADPPSQLSTQ
jgi:hypothetical protein